MRSEWRKLAVLPTPKWTVAATGAVVLVATIVIAIAGAGEDNLPFLMGIGLPTWIGSIVLGAWMSGLEYGQKTMRRTLTRNPDRLSVVRNKLTVALLAGVGLTIFAALIAIPLFSLASMGHELKVSASDVITVGIGNLPNTFIYVIAGFSFGLLTRSMAGGMTLALVAFFVVDSLLTQIPVVGNYMLAAASDDIFQAIVGTEIYSMDSEVNLARAIAVSALWLVALFGISTLRFVRTDVD